MPTPIATPTTATDDLKEKTSVISKVGKWFK
jgi:hypothetical protein